MFVSDVLGGMERGKKGVGYLGILDLIGGFVDVQFIRHAGCLNSSLGLRGND